MKISVIIPVYNCENYVQKCVLSVIGQTHTDLEIICVNDGSQDKSGLILDELAKEDSRIKVIHQINSGVTCARLAGVKEATGEYIGFVDGDDVVEADMFEFLLYNAATHDAQISHCGYQMIFKDGHVNYFYNTRQLLELNKTESVKALLEGTRIEPSLCNKLYHKSLFPKLLHKDYMPQSIKHNEDLLMNYYLFSEAERTVFEDKCKYHYLVRENSVSRQKLNTHKIFDPIKVKQIILNECSGDIEKYAQKAYLSTCISTYSELTLSRISEYLEEKRIIRNYIKAEKGWISLLSPKTRTLGYLILFVPLAVQIMYPIYAKLMRGKKYD